MRKSLSGCVLSSSASAASVKSRVQSRMLLGLERMEAGEVGGGDDGEGVGLGIGIWHSPQLKVFLR